MKTLSIVAAALGLALAVPMASTEASAQYYGDGYYRHHRHSGFVERTGSGISSGHSFHRGRYLVSVYNYRGRGGRRCHTVTRSVYGHFGDRHIVGGAGGCN